MIAIEDLSETIESMKATSGYVQRKNILLKEKRIQEAKLDKDILQLEYLICERARQNQKESVFK